MYIILAAATVMEVLPLMNELATKNRFPYHEIVIVITGVGQVSTTYTLTRKIMQRKPDLILQAGIAGSLDKQIPPLSIVAIRTECWADLGVMENNLWKNIFELGLEEPDLFPYSEGVLRNPLIDKWNVTGLREVNGVTVNEILTSTKRLGQARIKFQAQVESMEGAALHFVCLKEDVPFFQVRSISNFSGERDKKNWKMHAAITSLNESLISILSKL